MDSIDRLLDSWCIFKKLLLVALIYLCTASLLYALFKNKLFSKLHAMACVFFGVFNWHAVMYITARNGVQ